MRPTIDIDWNNLRAVQDEITRWATEQFPHRTDHQTIYKLMVHEIPELAIHKKEKGTEDIGPELADTLILLFDLASMWEVDVVEAVRAKMGVNYDRTWEMDVHGIMQHVPVVDDSQPAPLQPGAPRRINHMTCPKCGKTHNIFSTPPGNIRAYVCYDCGEEFDDDIPF